MLFAVQHGLAQDANLKKDSLKLQPLERSPLSADSLTPDKSVLEPVIRPIDRFNPSALYNANRNAFSLNNVVQTEKPSIIQPYGSTEQFINSKSSMAGALFMVSPRLNFYSSATLGLVETPMTGKMDYYRINAGAMYAVNPAITFHGDVDYHSNFGLVPLWNTSLNIGYRPGHHFQLNGGLSYLTTGANDFGVNQSSLMFHGHTRFRLADDLYMNLFGGVPVYRNRQNVEQPMPMFPQTYFGGTLEYWFMPTTAVEGGIIWQENIFTKKKIASPVIGIKIDPKRK